MPHKIISIIARNDYVLEATFCGGAKKSYNVKQLYTQFPQFHLLESEKGLFEKVKVDAGGYGISWNDELDLDSESIWEFGTEIGFHRETDINRILAYRLLIARENAKMTQKQLAEKTGIYQADISKIERGQGNPSIATLVRLADGMGMDLTIDFVTK